jgi:hypothetical protein
MRFTVFKHLGCFLLSNHKQLALIILAHIGKEKNCDTIFRKLAINTFSPLNFSVLSGVNRKKSPVSSASKMSLPGYPSHTFGLTVLSHSAVVSQFTALASPLTFPQEIL